MPGTPRDNFVRTRFHRRIYPLEPRPADVYIDDLIWSLSQICRFNGHTDGIYSVGQHSCHVHDLVKAWGAGEVVRAQALLHDGSEYEIGDLARPIKHAQGDPELEELGRVFRKVEARIQSAIYERFKLPTEEDPLVKEADRILLVTEQRDFMGHRPLAGNKGASLAQFQPLEQELKIWSPARTRRRFANRLRACGIDVPQELGF